MSLTTSTSTLLTRVLRLRYVFLTALCSVELLWRQRMRFGDYLYFEYFGRMLLGRTSGSHGLSTVLGFYVDYPKVQVGPPAMLGAVPLQLLPPHVGQQVSAAVMMAALIPCVFLLERIARELGAEVRRTSLLVLTASPAVIPLWGELAVFYMHFDDVLIYLLALGAILVALRQRDVLAAVLLGTAMATKPWAIALAPLLLVAPRVQLPRVALAWITGFFVWWAPFVAVHPDTFVSLGDAAFPLQKGSLAYLLGVHGDGHVLLCVANDCANAAWPWMRPLQFTVCVLGATLTVRRGRWLAAPLVGLVLRVAMDPQVWPYYAAGPVLMSLVWDLAQGRRLPCWTFFTAACLSLYVVTPNTTLQAFARLLLTVVTVAWFVVRPRRAVAGGAEATESGVVSRRAPASAAGAVPAGR